jgi:hypothetical protein
MQKNLDKTSQVCDIKNTVAHVIGLITDIDRRRDVCVLQISFDAGGVRNWEVTTKFHRADFENVRREK